MPKQKACQRQPPSKQPKGQKSPRRTRAGRRSIVVIGLILCLGLTSLLMAQWRAIRSSLSSLAPVPTPTPSLAASNPSKEYIYAGGKLVATEEPSNSSSTLSAPANFTAHAATTSTSTAPVTLSWPATGATSYVIERSTNYTADNQGFSTLTTLDCTSGCSTPVTYTDSVPVNTAAITYLYRVRALSGSQQSSPSAFDFITTKSFAETISNQDPNRTTINATHFLELKAAVDAVRATAGLQPFNWSDTQGRVPASGAPILRSHMGDLRSALNQALSALGVTPQPFSDEGAGTTMPPAGTAVRKAHLDELRQRTKSLGYWPGS